MTGVYSIPMREAQALVRAMITVVACGTMAACAHMPWSSSPRDTSAMTKAQPLPQATLAPPAKLPAQKPARTARAVPPPTAPQPKSEAAPAPLAQVIGLSQDDIRKTWDEPKERIAQGAGEAWVYKNPRCTLEIVFFLDVTRNSYYALDRKISGTDGTDMAARTCLMEIQNARQ
jgi:hypothetical protein